MSLSGVAAALAVRVAGEFNSLRAVLAGKADAGHKHTAGDITTGVLPAARGGTNNGSIGPSGSLAYSDGSRIAYTAAVGGAMVLESGDSIGDPPQWGSRLSRHSTQVVGAEPNDFLLNGWRFFSSGTVDLPTSDASYTISVLNNGSGPAASIEQRAIRWPDGMVFRRMRSNGIWGAWSRVHLTEEETDSRYDAAVRANAPSNPRPGQQWWDERNVVLKIWTGSRWQRVGEEVGAIKSFYGTVAQVPDVARQDFWQGRLVSP